MARKHRVWFPGAMYHVISRGNNQAAIYVDRKDHLEYLSLVKDSKELYPFSLHAYCLMYNHVHLLIETHKFPLTDIMKFINTNYAIYFNKRYDKKGHVFQGRYRADIIADRSYFLNANRYIHRNPLEANIVKKLEDYPWSSYSSYISTKPNILVTSEKILSQFPEPQLENYLSFLFAPNPNKEKSLCRL
jgi:REP element-mobilizing transposase RayT